MVWAALILSIFLTPFLEITSELDVSIHGSFKYRSIVVFMQILFLILRVPSDIDATISGVDTDDSDITSLRIGILRFDTTNTDSEILNLAAFQINVLTYLGSLLIIHLFAHYMKLMLQSPGCTYSFNIVITMLLIVSDILQIQIQQRS